MHPASLTAFDDEMSKIAISSELAAKAFAKRNLNYFKWHKDAMPKVRKHWQEAMAKRPKDFAERYTKWLKHKGEGRLSFSRKALDETKKLVKDPAEARKIVIGPWH